MLPQPLQLPWENPGWFEEVKGWIHDQLAQHGLEISSPIEILHQRNWSTFAKVSTNKGIFYFKAPAPLPFSAYEAPLTAALARWRPDCTVPVLAVDVARGWTLTADAGVTLRSMGRNPEQVDHWLKLLPLYVELQMQMMEHVPELLAIGVPDRRLANMPRLYNELLDDGENLRVGLKDGPEHKRIRDAYLEPWTALETRKKVTAAFKLAYPLAMVNRALSWAAGTGTLAKEHKEAYADFVPGWLQEYLQFAEGD